MTENDPTTQTAPSPEPDDDALAEQTAPDTAPDASVPEDSAEPEDYREQARRLEEQLLRRAAEFQNYRRRTDDEMATAAARGRAEVVLPLLDVLDDLRRSLEAAEAAAEEEQGGLAYQALKTGVDLVTQKFEGTLRSFGVEEIAAVGEPFDENLHEAMMQQETADAPAGTVLGEVQKGYRMGDRILRHARVVVAQ